MIATIAVCVLSFAVVVLVAVLLHTHGELKRARAACADLQGDNLIQRVNVRSLVKHCRELETALAEKARVHDVQLTMIANSTSRLFLVNGDERHD